MNPPKSPPQHRLRWMRWYKSKAEERKANNLTAHGTPRIYKKLPKPGHITISSIVDEMIQSIHAVYQLVPFEQQARFNHLARKLAAIKRHNPGKRVRVQ